MRLRLGFRMLIAVCVVLAILLSMVAVEQYRWSMRVAAADIQRERDHLNASAALFVTRFNRNVADAAGFLRDDAQTAVSADVPVPSPPRIIDGLYLVYGTGVQIRVERLNASGIFHAVATPEWAKPSACMSSVSQYPLAILTHLSGAVPGSSRCLYASLDESYIRGTLVPQLLRETFGESSMKDYDFAIVSRKDEAEPVYGPNIAPDLRRSFFAMPHRTPSLLLMLHEDAHGTLPNRVPGREQSRVRMGARGAPGVPPPQGDELWELQIAHRVEPFAVALRHERRRELLLSLTAELLFGAAVVLLLIGAHRMQQAAEDRMRFVAVVSHVGIPLKAISDSGGKPIIIPEANRSGLGAKRRWHFDVGKPD